GRPVMKDLRVLAATLVVLLPLRAGQTKAPATDRVQALLKDLEDDDEAIRLEAVTALADLGPRAAPAVAALVKALHVKNEDLRLNAALALGKVGKPAVPALADLLSSKDDDVRFYAVWALG